MQNMLVVLMIWYERLYKRVWSNCCNVYMIFYKNGIYVIVCFIIFQFFVVQNIEIVNWIFFFVIDTINFFFFFIITIHYLFTCRSIYTIFFIVSTVLWPRKKRSLSLYHLTIIFITHFLFSLYSVSVGWADGQTMTTLFNLTKPL